MRKVNWYFQKSRSIAALFFVFIFVAAPFGAIINKAPVAKKIVNSDVNMPTPGEQVSPNARESLPETDIISGGLADKESLFSKDINRKDSKLLKDIIWKENKDELLDKKTPSKDITQDIIKKRQAKADKTSASPEVQSSKAPSRGMHTYSYDNTTTFSWIDTSAGTRLLLYSTSGSVTTDEGTNQISLPFDFIFFDTVYPEGSPLYVSSNGFLSLGENASYLGIGSASFPTNSYGPIIAPYGADLDTGEIQGSGVWYLVQGSAPNRQLIITYNMTHYWYEYDSAHMTFQVILFENGTIVFQYDHIGVASTTSSNVTGLNAGNGMDGVMHPNLYAGTANFSITWTRQAFTYDLGIVNMTSPYIAPNGSVVEGQYPLTFWVQNMGTNSLGGTLNVSVISPEQFVPAYTESFEDTTFPPAGWFRADSSGTSADWTRVTSGTYPTCSPYNGTAMAKFNSFSASSGNAEFLGAEFNLTALAVNAVAFWMYHDTGYSSTNDRVILQYSTDNITFNTITSFKRYTGTTGWAMHAVTLPYISNRDHVWIGLLGVSGYGNNIYVGDFMLGNMTALLSETLTVPVLASGESVNLTLTNMLDIAANQNLIISAVLEAAGDVRASNNNYGRTIYGAPNITDIAVTGIVNPKTTQGWGIIYTNATLKNNGYTVAGGSAHLEILENQTGGNYVLVYSEDTTFAPILPGATTYVVFPNGYNFTENKIYCVNVSISVVNDSNSSNDYYNKSFEIKQIQDIQVSSLTVTGDQVGESMNVSTTIRNIGTLNATDVEVIMTIMYQNGTAVYSNTTLINLTAGSSRTLAYPSYPLTQPGQYLITIVANWAMDLNPSNNKLTKKVSVFGSTPAAFYDFPTNSLPSGWVASPSSSGTEWEVGTPTLVGPDSAYSPPYCVGTNINSNYTNEASANLTLTINLSGVVAAYISFWTWYSFEYDEDSWNSYYDGGELLISTDNGLTWEKLYSDLYDEVYIFDDGLGYGWSWDEWIQDTIDLSYYVGQTVLLRFHMASDMLVTDAGWYIDDVAIYTVPAPGNDTGIKKLSTFNNPVPPGEGEPINVTVKNYGTISQNNVPVYVEVKNASGIYTQTFTDTVPNLAPGQEVNLTFSWAVPAGNDTYTIRAWTELANDENIVNNELTIVREAKIVHDISITVSATYTSYIYKAGIIGEITYIYANVTNDGNQNETNVPIVVEIFNHRGKLRANFSDTIPLLTPKSQYSAVFQWIPQYAYIHYINATANISNDSYSYDNKDSEEYDVLHYYENVTTVGPEWTLGPGWSATSFTTGDPEPEFHTSPRVFRFQGGITSTTGNLSVNVDCRNLSSIVNTYILLNGILGNGASLKFYISLDGGEPILFARASGPFPDLATYWL
ncbi:MAG: CARDB domain-containing protein, partial [Thermoplasmata archaeon]